MRVATSRALQALPVLPALLATLALVSAGAAAAADLRRVESVGVFPIQPGGARQAPRDGAVRAALARGVEHVADQLLPEGWRAALPETPSSEAPPKPSAPEDIETTLARALGTDPFEYATRFRTLEDRGLRQALFSQDPEVEREYVVVVEVYVDADRVGDRLRAAGWIDDPGGPGPTAHVRLVLTGLASFGAYDALRRTLLEELEVRSVLPVELSRGRAVLAVDGPYGAADLEEALLSRPLDGLRVVPLEREGQTLTLLVDWTPPPSGPASPAEGDAEDEAPADSSRD